MKKNIMQQWVAALRSKKYKQGRRLLKYKHKDGTTRHCCLGVLCELYQKDRRKQQKQTLRQKIIRSSAADFLDVVPSATVKTAAVIGFKSSVKASADLGVLPAVVMRWAGLQTETGAFKNDALTLLNDHGKSFAQIADVIEKNCGDL
jgi:hypothetical protein